MLIRPFAPSDASALADLFHASVREAGIRDYSAEQVAVWSPARPDPARYLRQAENRIFLVVVDESGQPIAYGDVEMNGHIDHLYCHPAQVGTGVGAALYLALEVAAREAGISRLFVEASEAARRLFERQGFQMVERQEFLRHGVLIHNYRMAKTLLPR
ncbi:GNAT family N-acetyltransferase [Nissabacter sp. SGAir0207]|uniref:GNAT family N-acetyltransferase n=1 Tax=Nissabacter sp. SGAir0207 TaxID=2126321 RepID=UPI0010CD5F6C|nr:GNAT family N-acetyltransferase [Nissabacter sp. SGAir0207]QCR38174.1 GNAT family N-acetyltransferase [Nissabacter sp. SGAir0207]